MKRVMSLIATMALIWPPMPVTAGPIMVAICGQPATYIALPVKPRLPHEGDDHMCCKKGCHAANERKKRGAGKFANGPDDDSCCE